MTTSAQDLSVATQSQVTHSLDSAWVRSQFPSLSQTVNGHPAVFLDGPGGTQVPQRVIDAISDYLRSSNANTDGVFATSQRTDAMLAGAREAMADFLACDPDEVVFGANMTSFTFAISRSIGRELNPGDEIVVTRLDHGANYSPWVALEERGVTIRVAEIHDQDCTLDMEDLAQNHQPHQAGRRGLRLECGGNDQQREMKWFVWRIGWEPWPTSMPCTTRRMVPSTCARSIATSWSAPLTNSSAPTWACSMASTSISRACSLTRSRPIPMRFPLIWEWGTLNHECIAGITACVDYLADLGRHIDPSASARRSRCSTRRLEGNSEARADPGRKPHFRALEDSWTQVLWHHAIRRASAIAVPP